MELLFQHPIVQIFLNFIQFCFNMHNLRLLNLQNIYQNKKEGIISFYHDGLKYHNQDHKL